MACLVLPKLRHLDSPWKLEPLHTRITRETELLETAGPMSPTGLISKLCNMLYLSQTRGAYRTNSTHSSWSTNIATSAGACKSLSLEPNSDSENTVLKAAIKQAGTDTGLDPRFILAAVFQESTGCVRVKTSYSSNENIRNPGLLQCDNGEHTCNDEKRGISQLVPCPDAQIKGRSSKCLFSL